MKRRTPCNLQLNMDAFAVLAFLLDKRERLLLRLLCKSHMEDPYIFMTNEEALRLSIFNCHEQVACARIEAGADVNKAYNNRFTPLTMSAKRGLQQVTLKLIEAGAVVDKAGPGGITALMFAIFRDREQVVCALINAKANLDVKDDRGDTAFMIAARNGHQKIALALIQAGASIRI